MGAITGNNLNFGSVNGLVVGQDVADPSKQTYYPVSSEWDGIANELRVKCGGSSSMLALLAGMISKAGDGAEATGTVRAAVEALLYEMQHPKQVLYEGLDTAVPVGGVYLSPWIDTNLLRFIGYYWANTGLNVMTSFLTYWSEDPAGAGPFIAGSGGAAALAIGTCWYTQDGTITNNGWVNTRFAPLAARYLRLWASSALGTTGRCKIVGMR